MTKLVRFAYNLSRTSLREPQSLTTRSCDWNDGLRLVEPKPPFHYSIFGVNSEAPKDLYILSRL